MCNDHVFHFFHGKRVQRLYFYRIHWKLRSSRGSIFPGMDSSWRLTCQKPLLVSRVRNNFAWLILMVTSSVVDIGYRDLFITLFKPLRSVKILSLFGFITVMYLLPSMYMGLLSSVKISSSSICSNTFLSGSLWVTGAELVKVNELLVSRLDQFTDRKFFLEVSKPFENIGIFHQDVSAIE